MTSSTHIYGALIAGCAAGWCLRELWLRDAARREAEVRPAVVGPDRNQNLVP